MCPGVQNMETGPDDLGTAEKRVRARKTLKRDTTPSEPPKMSKGTQNKKTGPDALGTAENESGSAKHEKGTRRPQNRRKRVWVRKTQ
jgi:hypothetical protein